MTTTMTPPTTAAKAWDDVRTAFASSIMVDTALSSLAQNLDGLEWPISGSDETPSAYIDLTYQELCLRLSSRGQASGAELLTRILRETLAFDQPFGDMVKQTEAASQRDNALLRTLSRLGIPEDFPIGLTALDEAARELCRLEGMRTLGQFALFSQGLSQTVIVGGDFRRLLNVLAHVDERALADLLPFRPGSTSLHLAESLGQGARTEHAPEHTARALEWFAKEFADWQRQAAENPSFIARQLAVLNDAVLEKQITLLLAPHLSVRSSRPSYERPGLWAGFVRWLKS